jgi:GGDEF domain-containing protein
LAQRIVASLSQPIVLSAGVPVAVGVSVGIATYADDVALPETLLARADQELYAAKQQAPGRRLQA